MLMVNDKWLMINDIAKMYYSIFNYGEYALIKVNHGLMSLKSA
jgi:hypothetical protein